MRRVRNHPLPWRTGLLCLPALLAACAVFDPPAQAPGADASAVSAASSPAPGAARSAAPTTEAAASPDRVPAAGAGASTAAASAAASAAAAADTPPAPARANAAPRPPRARFLPPEAVAAPPAAPVGAAPSAAPAVVTVAAPPVTPMRFTTFRACVAARCENRVLAQGMFEIDTAPRFEAWLTREQARADALALPARPEVWFNSGGGNVAGAIAFGRSLRRHKLSTRLAGRYAQVVDNAEQVLVSAPVCASACSLAFIGGVNRSFEGEFRYGIHQYSAEGGGAHGDGEAQRMMVALAGYLEEMDVERTLLDLAALVNPDQIYWLNEKQLRELNVDNMSVAVAAWKLDAWPSGTVYAAVTQVKPGTRAAVTLQFYKRNKVPVIAVVFTPAAAGENEPGLRAAAARALNRGGSALLTVDNNDIGRYPRLRWQALKGERLMAVLPLTPQALYAISRGAVLQFTAGLPPSAAAVDPTLAFQIGELPRLMRAALK